MTNDLEAIAEKCNSSSKRINIFFSTYESNNVIMDLIKKYNIVFDFAVYDQKCKYFGFLPYDNVFTNISLNFYKKRLDIDWESYLLFTNF
ncbi:hypothetical protein MCAV_06760 [[Mycoplasma] cavipharyngis]|uniref:hypothetical protein n=1 Tax=[Mycoplasma] cavipharyngis TaxID=92757 RepID=UPI0037041229